MYSCVVFKKPIEAAFLCNMLTLLMILESLTVIQQESCTWNPLYLYLYDISSNNWNVKWHTERRIGVQRYLSKPREEDNKEVLFFYSEVHLKLVKKYNLKLQQMATFEYMYATRKDDPMRDLVSWYLFCKIILQQHKVGSCIKDHWTDQGGDAKYGKSTKKRIGKSHL